MSRSTKIYHDYCTNNLKWKVSAEKSVGDIIFMPVL